MNVFLVARRDLAAYLNSASGYIIVAALTFVLGLLFNALSYFAGPAYSHELLEAFFTYAFGTTLTTAVFLSMRSFAEEASQGTDVLLETAPIRPGEIVLGKYLAGLGMISIFLMLTLYMPFLILWNGKIAIGHLVVGYFGLLLVGSAGTAIGNFGSSLSKSQVVAVVLSGVMVTVMMILGEIGQFSDAPLDAIHYLDLFDTHFPAFQSGRLELSGVVFYLSTTAVFLWMTTQVLKGRRWQ
ncbi:MAG: ABC transporter permease [Proteobacteria bacterium]|nr:ABC transporter permease [Pseudomonadota bacterium]